jgi:hypothetical protein
MISIFGFLAVYLEGIGVFVGGDNESPAFTGNYRCAFKLAARVIGRKLGRDILPQKLVEYDSCLTLSVGVLHHEKQVGFAQVTTAALYLGV